MRILKMAPTGLLFFTATFNNANIQNRIGMAKRLSKKTKTKKGITPPSHSPHRFHHSVARRWGFLAIALTLLFIVTEVTSPITPKLIGNMAAVILAVGVILAMFITVSRARLMIQESIRS